MSDKSGSFAANLDLEVLRERRGLHTPASLGSRARALGAQTQIVDGLLPSRSVSVLVGDSGLGKSPLLYQLGISVACGLPFLGRATRQGRVVIADFENGLEDMRVLVERISSYLGISQLPEDGNLLLWPMNDSQLNYGQHDCTLFDILRDAKPTLAIIDSLSSYNPQAEEKNSAANQLLQDFRRQLVGEFGMTIQFAHHRRKLSSKPGEAPEPLERAHLRQWFQDARGASALINGADIRLGADAPDLSATAKDEVALVVRGYGRVRGEIGPLYLARVMDETGEPLGYRVLTGPELLMNTEQEEAFRLVPVRFSFSDAKRIYGRSDQPTRNWLLRCIALGIVRQLGRGSYERVQACGASGEGR